MVYASETFGAAPVLVASLITSMGFASHHSPDHYRHISSVNAGPTTNKRTKVNSFVDMDNASIIATFPADLREEVCIFNFVTRADDIEFSMYMSPAFSTASEVLIHWRTTLHQDAVSSGYKNKRKKGRKLDSGNQVRQRFRESFQEERAAIRGIVPKEKEGEQQYWELFPKEGRPIGISGNQSKENCIPREDTFRKRGEGRKRFREYSKIETNC
ncbi:E3 ubiquitin protein ligase UPL1-like protein isoform X1 [Tanacetum coccineum]